MSRAIGDELEDQAGLLDQLGGEIDSAQGRMSATLAKIQRVTRYVSIKTQVGICRISFLLFSSEFFD